MSTKKRIIETAKALFNSFGTKNISTNHIAKELNMSPGNLYYHYKNKEEIIRDIYLEMLESLKMVWNSFNTDKPSLLSFRPLFEIYKVLYENRYFQYEIISLLENDKILKEMYNKNREIRYDNFNKIISKMIDEGYLEKENQHKYISLLTDQLWFSGDFWMTYAKSINHEFDEIELQKLLLTQLSLIHRYSTDKGKKLITRLEKIIGRIL